MPREYVWTLITFHIVETADGDAEVFDCIIKATSLERAMERLEKQFIRDYPDSTLDGDGGVYFPDEGGIVIRDAESFDTEAEADKARCGWHSYYHLPKGA